MSKSVIEDCAFTPFLKKLTIYCSGGPFLDGYILVIIGAALVQLGRKAMYTLDLLALKGVRSNG